MKESNFNSVIIKTFNSYGNGWAYKIPDPQGIVAVNSVKRPFDVIANYDNESYYIESKLLKNDFLNFNFKRLEDHQVWNLKQIKESNEYALCLVFIAYWISRKIYEFFVLDIEYILKQIGKNKKSLLKKELLELKQNNMSVKIKKGKFDIDEMRSKIIGY